MAQLKGRTVQTVTRRDPMLTKGGKVPVSSNVGTIRPPSGGSKPTPTGGQASTGQNR